MLQTIRDRLTGWFAVFILGAIALTLVLTFGNIDTGFTSGGVAATVNGDDILMQDFRRLYQRQRQQWETAYRNQMPEALAAEVADQTVQSLIRNRVIAQHVRDQGYRVNDSEVIAAVEATPAFQVAGRFSRPAYEQLLATQRMSTQRFEFEQRQDMEVSQFIEGLAYTAFYTPSEFRRYIELDGETRDVEYLALSPDNWREQVVIDAEAILAHYESNQALYMSQESVALEYIELDFNSVLETVSVTAEEVRAYYDANPQEFGGPEERQASHILLSLDEEEELTASSAEELKQQLDEGVDFAGLAAEYSDDSGSASNGGSLGWLSLGDAPAPEFEEALFALQEGEVSEPVRTQFGYHLIRLDGIRPGQSRQFAEVRTELTQTLREDAAADIFSERVDELDEGALESIDGLAGVAEDLGEALGTVENFTRSGGLPLGFTPDLIATVFSLEVLEDGENSPVIDLGEGRAAVMHVTEHRPAKVKPLEDVEEEIRIQLTDQEAIALVSIAGSELLDQLRVAESSTQAELPGGVEWQTFAEIRRGAPELPAELAGAVFRAPKPGAGGPRYSGMLLATGEYAIYRVTAQHPGTPDSYPQEERDVRKQQLAGRLGGGQATGMVETLVAEASVRVADDLLGLDGELL